MELVTDHVFRALKYVQVLNASQEAPTPSEVDLFATTIAPTDATYRSAWDLSLKAFDVKSKTSDPQPVSGYLARMGWIETPGGRAHVTARGLALLRGLEGDLEAAAPSSSSVVVLEANSPMAPVHLARAAADAGAGMYVDKYLRVEHLEWVLQNTSLTRILVGMASERGVLATALGSLPDAGRVEVRLYGDRDLHDRALLRGDGGVTLIGASINGVGRHTTVIVPLPPSVSGAYAAQLERMWDQAEPILPTQLASGS